MAREGLDTIFSGAGRIHNYSSNKSCDPALPGYEYCCVVVVVALFFLWLFAESFAARSSYTLIVFELFLLLILCVIVIVVFIFGFCCCCCSCC